MVLSCAGVGVGRGGGEGGREGRAKGVAGKGQAGVGSETGAHGSLLLLASGAAAFFPKHPEHPEHPCLAPSVHFRGSIPMCSDAPDARRHRRYLIALPCPGV
jgi:hypothetical protein